MTDWLDLDSRAVWHPFTPTPFQGPRALFTRAKGAYLYDERGKAYFDATSSWWCNTHGHCHPRLVAALARQADTLDQILFAPHTHPVAVELAVKLLSRLGAPFARVFFSDDGSTAVEAALKMAGQYWSNRGEPRHRFLSMELGYHGDTMGAVSVSRVEAFHRSFQDLGQGVGKALGLVTRQATAPYCYRCPLGLEHPECRTACLDSTERWLAEHGHEVAAVIVEPLMLGAGGMIAYPADYLSRLVALCRSYGCLVIFDEVFTGFGRTGTFFAMDQMTEKPDIICLSKGLTAGMLPSAVTAVSAEVYDAFGGGAGKAFYHGHTFTANALGLAVALESLAIFEEEKVIERNQRLVDCMAKGSARFRELPRVGEVRQLGMVWALELVEDRKTRAAPRPANGPGWKIAARLWEEGFWIRPLHNVLYCVPPYCSTESELQALFSVLYSELQDDRHFKS